DVAADVVGTACHRLAGGRGRRPRRDRGDRQATRRVQAVCRTPRLSRGDRPPRARNQAPRPAQVRLRSGRRLASAALVAARNHARVAGFVSLGGVACALLVGLGLERADPLTGLAITLVILKTPWDSWQTIRAAEIDITHIDDHDHPDDATPAA